VVVLGVLLFVVEPLGVALYVNAKPRIPVDPAALGIAHEDVTFRSSDGLRLGGWYVPSRNGAAVLVVHGSGGSRGGAVLHARMLARAGYGVLLYDARGRGGSEGDPEGMGWTWQRDVAGALAWLKARHDVDPDRIAGLGLSTGAEVLLQAAAQRHDLHAVVADGTEARSLGEARELGARDAAVIGLIGMMELGTRALTGHAPPPELKSLAARVGRDRLMLISTGTGPEAKYSRIYARAAGAPLWELPGTAHTKGLATHPREYERRVLGFLGPPWRASVSAVAPYTIMGIVNVTPDSFSDGGAFEDHVAAIATRRRLVAEGAAIVDVGGESTPPARRPVPPAEELGRVLPVVEGVAGSAWPRRSRSTR
jgi:hypothetical protein